MFELHPAASPYVNMHVCFPLECLPPTTLIWLHIVHRGKGKKADKKYLCRS
jgi:hypothetical protein